MNPIVTKSTLLMEIHPSSAALWPYLRVDQNFYISSKRVFVTMTQALDQSFELEAHLHHFPAV